MYLVWIKSTSSIETFGGQKGLYYSTCMYVYFHARLKNKLMYLSMSEYRHLNDLMVLICGRLEEGTCLPGKINFGQDMSDSAGLGRFNDLESLQDTLS